MDHPLKLFREMRGLSQDGLAQLIGTTKATISRLESGER
jgi:DNA-binding XRE family transcriptional regulator